MTALYLLRHGPTNAGIKGMPIGTLDVSINLYGNIVWPIVRSNLLQLKLERVLTSCLVRASCHALDLLPVNLQQLSGFNEQNFGQWEGIPWSKISEAQKFLKNPIYNVPPGGESFLSCANRVVTTFNSVWNSNKITLILAHSGSLRAILAYLLGLTLEDVLRFTWQPYGISKIEVYNNICMLCYHDVDLVNCSL